jgi:hypothetical protein
MPAAHQLTTSRLFVTLQRVAQSDDNGWHRLAASLAASLTGARRTLSHNAVASAPRLTAAIALLIANASAVFSNGGNADDDNDDDDNNDVSSRFPASDVLDELRASYDAAPATVTLSLRNFSKAGLLSLRRTKKGAKVWQKRYCVIKSHYLFIFKAEGDETPIGIANLHGPAFQVTHVRCGAPLCSCILCDVLTDTPIVSS